MLLFLAFFFRPVFFSLQFTVCVTLTLPKVGTFQIAITFPISSSFSFFFPVIGIVSLPVPRKMMMMMIVVLLSTAATKCFCCSAHTVFLFPLLVFLLSLCLRLLSLPIFAFLSFFGPRRLVSKLNRVVWKEESVRLRLRNGLLKIADSEAHFECVCVH